MPDDTNAISLDEFSNVDLPEPQPMSGAGADLDTIDYANLSGAAYGEDEYPIPNGMELLGNVEDSETGYAMSYYGIRNEEGEITSVVFAHRGSDDSKLNLPFNPRGEDWESNLSVIGFKDGDMIHAQYPGIQDAMDAFQDKYPNIKVTHTGHSLGGYLAEMLTANSKHDSEAVSFDPLFSDNNLHGKDYDKALDNITRILPKGKGAYEESAEIIEGEQKAATNINVGSNHDLDNIIEDIENGEARTWTPDILTDIINRGNKVEQLQNFIGEKAESIKEKSSALFNKIF